MENKFIDHNDPTKQILGEYSKLQQQYDKLTDQEKVIVGASLLGMNHIPVSFDQFIQDDYYLGNASITNHGNSIFDIWKRAGNEIFPTEISTSKPYTLLTGGIGLNKSGRH
jgi:hypothetical protein